MKNFGEPCVLEDRLCTECGECDLCDLDPTKQCDNCCQCVKTLECDYVEIGIDDILVTTEDPSSDQNLEKAGQVPGFESTNIEDLPPFSVSIKSKSIKIK